MNQELVLEKIYSGRGICLPSDTKMTDEDIERAVKDAEAHAEEDKKKKEVIVTSKED